MLAVGCGSSHKATHSASGVSGVIHAYLQAQANGDGSTACSLLTPAAQKQLTSLVVKEGKGLVSQRPSCQDAVGLVRLVAGSQVLSALKSARVEHVQVSGTTATAEVVDGTAFPSQQVTLEKTAGRWQITGVPGLGG